MQGISVTSVSPPPGRLGGLDTLRGLAAVAVLLCHVAAYWAFMDLPGKLPQLFDLMAQGVDIFIVISGFVLFYPVLRSGGHLDARQFFGRRTFRILPAYYVGLAIAAALALNPSTARYVVAEPANWGQVLIHVLGVQTWFPGSLGSINGSLWSVSLELHLYLVFPPLVLAWRRWGIVPVLVVSAILALVWNLMAGGPSYGDYGLAVGGGHALPARFVQFVAGMACAYWVVRRGVPPLRGSVVLATASVLAAVTASSTDQSAPIRHLAWAAAGVGLVLLTSSLARSREYPPMTERFGERAYSFYLLHQPIVLLLAPLAGRLDGWVTQLVIGSIGAFTLTSIAAALMYRWVELPTHRLGRRLFPRPSRTATGAGPVPFPSD
ncbi:acyltransferase [uncultured Ornithinimicrobium sp.]|uniref:acyltransferase family protein n=1 Tax=uncultured Ornithinimicrobium sp. TaxID=259307 RepID=UPI0025994759|nr:acyltransferase [uncultured Ornithinimicrobium sp.]